MTIEFETPHLVLCIRNYYGTMEDGREFTIVSHSNYGSVWIEDIEIEDDFTDEELEEVRTSFYQNVDIG
jgi:hypothetical protein